MSRTSLGPYLSIARHGMSNARDEELPPQSSLVGGEIHRLQFFSFRSVTVLFSSLLSYSSCLALRRRAGEGYQSFAPTQLPKEGPVSVTRGPTNTRSLRCELLPNNPGRPSAVLYDE